MKKIILLFLLIMFDLQKIYAVEPWIHLNPPHVLTVNEFTDITAALISGKIIPRKKYTLSTGNSFSIAHPKEYLECIIMCVKASDPSVATNDDVIRAIQNGDVQLCGNDVSCKVENYYFSNLYHETRFVDDFSPKNLHCLFINGNPTIKMEDCGNPLKVKRGYENISHVESSETTSQNLEPKPKVETKPRIKTEFVQHPKEKDDLVFRSAPRVSQRTINLDMPLMEKPYSEPTFFKHKFPWGAIVIPVAIIGAGTAGYFIWKNQQKKPDNGSPVTNGGHGDGGPVTNGGHP